MSASLYVSASSNAAMTASARTDALVRSVGENINVNPGGASITVFLDAISTSSHTIPPCSRIRVMLSTTITKLPVTNRPKDQVSVIIRDTNQGN